MKLVYTADSSAVDDSIRWCRRKRDGGNIEAQGRHFLPPEDTSRTDPWQNRDPRRRL